MNEARKMENFQFRYKIFTLNTFLRILLMSVGMLYSEVGMGQLFWNTNGTGALITATNWGTVATGPFSTAWTNSSNIVFTANSAITYVTGTPVANISLTSGTTSWTGAGTYTTGGVVRTIDVASGASLTWNNQNVSLVAGNGFIKSGLGTWNIGAQANLYTGGFTLNNGTVIIGGNNALGGGVLNLNGGVLVPNSSTARTLPSSSINIGGNVQLGDAVNVSAGTGNIVFTNGVSLGAATRTLTIGGAGQYQFSSAIGGGGAGVGLTISSTSTGRIVLNATCSYQGATTINSGTLQAGVANCLQTNTSLSLANVASAQFLLNNNSTTVGSIAGGGATGGNISMGTGNLSTGGNSSSTSYGGVISGSGSFTKTGSGTQTLTGANIYTGATNVTGGSLLVNGSTAASSNVTVSSGATLGGSGTVAGAVAVNGIIDPGGSANTTATLNTGATTFGANSTYLCNVTNVGGTQGTSSGWDFINSSGAITVTANPIKIDLVGIVGNGFNNNSAYTWLIATGTSIVGFNSSNITITQNFGATGTFSVEQSGNSIQLVYTPPFGNTITLSPASQLSGSSFCNGSVSNTITLTYNTTGIVTAPAIELSNSSGSFASGTVQLPGSITPGTPNSITGIVPPGQTAGSTYRVRIISADATPVISANNGNNITITNSVTPSVSIAITTGANPSCTGSGIMFTATPVNGGASPGFQWRKNGIDIPGEIGAAYTTSTLVTGDVISCRLITSLSCVTASSALSNSLTLTVNSLPANPGNPVATGVNPACGSNSLSPMSPNPSTTFYWQGNLASGQSTASPTSAAYPVIASGTYYVRALSTDGCWSSGSGSITLTINSTPSLSVQPADRNINAGSNTTFSVTASNATGYQWQVDQGTGFNDIANGGVYSGATTATLTLTAVPVDFNGYAYRCLVKAGACADLISGQALLGVSPLPWEDFETGTKPGYANGNVNCTAGSWAFNNALLGTDVVSDFLIGNQSARIDINGTISMNFNLSSLGVVRLSHRMFGSDAAGNWQLQASVDNGATWTAFTSPVITSTATVQTANILVNIAGNVRFRIINLETSGNRRINIDNIFVTTYNGCTTPATQAGFTNVTSITTGSFTINFSAGTGGNGRIVVVKQGSPVVGFPTSGVNYVPGSSNFAAALPVIAANEKVVYNGNGNSVNVTGLNPNTTYYIQIFEYAGTNCYLVNSTSNTGSATTACNTPATNASGLVVTAITSAGATLTWTNGSGTNRLVVVNAGSTVTGSPVNGDTYSANASFSAAPAFTPGTGKTVFNGTGSSVTLSNLSGNTLYHVAVFEFNSGSNCYISVGTLTTFATVSQLSDIVTADGESACVSSIINGSIATVANGVQVWQFSVRDGGTDAPDADALPTIVNTITITQGAGNTVSNWTNIESAALFDGSTLIGNGTITSTSIAFSGSPLIQVADNSSKLLSLRITLKATTTIPNTIDGRVFRFSITEPNITLASSGTSGKNTGAPVATSDITLNPVCVVASKLVFTVQPSNTGQNDAMFPNVRVTAFDANNNVDVNFTQTVSLTSSAGAGLLGTPLSVMAIAGVATFTGIKHTATGTFTLTASCPGPGISSAVSNSFVINTVTTFAPGDFAILAVNNNNSNGVDEIAFVVFKDIVAGTSFYMTDNGYERANVGLWGGTEGVVRLTYTGAAAGGVVAPAGSVFVIQGNNTSFNILRCGVSDIGNWTINPRALFPSTPTAYLFNLNNNDQVWFTQGGNWTSASGSPTVHDASTDGTVLYGWTGIDWKANLGNLSSPTWTTQGSRLFSQRSCFSTNLKLPNDIGKYKYKGIMTATTRLGWITRINDVSNWTSYSSNALYDADPVNYAAGAGFTCPLTVSPGVPLDGKWTGLKNTDWFDCSNWDSKEVPNANMSVVIDNTATNDCLVDNLTNASSAVQYGNSANCFSLTISGRKLSTGNPNDTINVNGNFTLSGGASLDMTAGGTFNLQSGAWTRSSSTFLSGSGMVSYNSSGPQTIAAENYFNLRSISSGNRTVAPGTIGIANTFTPGTNSYSFTGSTIDYNGSGNQTIAPFSAGPAPGNTYHNLTLSGSGIKSLGGNTDVEADLTLNNSVVFSLGNQYLNLKSTIAKTARVAPISPTASITYGSGRFVVERYFPGKRAWRLVTAPVTADASNNIHQSWQEGGGTTRSGSGTWITGPNPSAANGLDASPQNNTSLRTFNIATGGFEPVLNTRTTRISGIAATPGTPDNVGYFLFVRGDRTDANVNAFNPYGSVNETTLRDTGRIQIRDYTFPCNPSVSGSNFTLIGNPYASPVDFDNITKTGVANKFWAWDPNLNTVGGYVIVDRQLGTTTTVPTGGATTQDKFIQSKQAFFVQTTGASPSIGFAESSKSNVNNLNLFRPQNNPSFSSLAVNIFVQNADGSSKIADGILNQFRDDFSPATDALDALRFGNVHETFGVLNGRDNLMLNRRPMPAVGDTLFFRMLRFNKPAYSAKLSASKLLKENLAAYWEDNYLKNSIALAMEGETSIDFTTNSDAASRAADRFRIVFRKLVDFFGIKAELIGKDALVQWTVTGDSDVAVYEVERSLDGGNSFSRIGTVASKHAARNQAADYAYTDLTPTPGIYHYRIKAISSRGVVAYTETVRVVVMSSAGNLYVFPNPVKAGQMNLQLNTVPAGNYFLRLIGSTGQLLFSNSFVHDGTRGMRNFNLPSSVIPGSYTLELGCDARKIKYVLPVIVFVE